MQIRVWGRSPEKVASCVSDIGGSNVVACDNLETACKDADVVVTVTMSAKPVLKGQWLKEGTVVLGIATQLCQYSF